MNSRSGLVAGVVDEQELGRPKELIWDMTLPLSVACITYITRRRVENRQSERGREDEDAGRRNKTHGTMVERNLWNSDFLHDTRAASRVNLDMPLHAQVIRVSFIWLSKATRNCRHDGLDELRRRLGSCVAHVDVSRRT